MKERKDKNNLIEYFCDPQSNWRDDEKKEIHQTHKNNENNNNKIIISQNKNKESENILYATRKRRKSE